MLSLLLMAVAGISGCITQSNNDANAGTTAETAKLLFTIASDGNTMTKFAYVEKGTNAFGAMKGLFDVEYTEYAGMGVMVNSINGIAASADEFEYWALYVDGVYADRGIDGYEIENDTHIKFELTKWQ